LPTFQLEAEFHDERTLPHLYEEEDVENMFPSIGAAEMQPNAEDWIPGADREEDEREREGTQAGRELSPRVHGGAAAPMTTDWRKQVRRYNGKGGKRVVDRVRKVDRANVRLKMSDQA
jgi:hypothetical protein